METEKDLQLSVAAQVMEMVWQPAIIISGSSIVIQQLAHLFYRNQVGERLRLHKCCSAALSTEDIHYQSPQFFQFFPVK